MGEMFNGINRLALHQTQFSGLKYTNTNPSGTASWRVVDCHDDKPATVGPHYRSRIELLSDLPRYARESWGY